MTCNYIKTLLVTCFWLLCWTQTCTSQGWYNGDDFFFNNRPDFWSWGFVDVTDPPAPRPLPTLSQDLLPPSRNVQRKPTPVTSTERATTTLRDDENNNQSDDDPCQPYNPQTPDFSKNGRRISIAKCHEYIWGISHLQEKIKRHADCERIKRQKVYEECARAKVPCSFGGVGGRDTLSGEFPHMGAIGWKATVGKWKFGCAGSLISSRFVLTAAHCTSASAADTSIADPYPKIIRFGDKNIVDAAARQYIYIDIKVDAEILRSIAHDRYNSPKKYFDIALMELTKDLEFTKLIHPACLWGRMDTARLGKRVTVTGWGTVKEGGVDISPELQALDIDIIETPLCDGLLRRKCNRLWCGVRSHQLCGGNLTGGVDACSGDSGGPLQVRVKLPTNTTGFMHTVVGVTSFGIGCARPNSPAIYTRVASFIDWIEDIVWPREEQ